MGDDMDVGGVDGGVGSCGGGDWSDTDTCDDGSGFSDALGAAGDSDGSDRFGGDDDDDNDSPGFGGGSADGVADADAVAEVATDTLGTSIEVGDDDNEEDRAATAPGDFSSSSIGLGFGDLGDDGGRHEPSGFGNLSFGDAATLGDTTFMSSELRTAYEGPGAEEAGDDVEPEEPSLTESVGAALRDPLDAISGYAKDTANFVLGGFEAMSRGLSYEAEGRAIAAGGLLEAMGADDAAALSYEAADIHREAAETFEVPEFTLDTPAERGGAVIGAGVEIALGVGALVKGAVRQGPRLVDAARGLFRRADDEVPPTVTSAPTRIDRQAGLTRVQDDIRAEGAEVLTDADPEIRELMDARARAQGLDPDQVEAITYGDVILVRDDKAGDARVLAEELQHVRQQRSGLAGSDNAADLEIEARQSVIDNAERYGLDDQTIRSLRDEIETIRERGFY